MDLHYSYTVVLPSSASLVLLNQLMYVTTTLESMYVYEALDRAQVHLDSEDPFAINHLFAMLKFSERLSNYKARKLVEAVHISYIKVHNTTDPKENGFAHRRIYRARRVGDMVHTDDTSRMPKPPITNLERPLVDNETCLNGTETV